jgi:hypothetical protein
VSATCIQLVRRLVDKLPMNNIIDYPPKHARQVRVSDRIKHAVSLIARHGLSQVDAAKAAGLSRQGLNEALKRPEVAELLRSARAALDGDIAQLRQVGRLDAIEKAMQLMRESKDEKIQLRAAEFWRVRARVPRQCRSTSICVNSLPQATDTGDLRGICHR